MTSQRRISADLVVLGAGPGGYTAAFRAADLGLKTVIVEKYPVLGGVCLNVGCVPSKTLLHVTSVLAEVNSFVADERFQGGVSYSLEALRQHKSKIVDGLNSGLAMLAKRRKIEVVTGEGQFASETELTVACESEQVSISFQHAIVATGSSSIRLPFMPASPRVWNATDALELPFIPTSLAIVGGGVIGLEMATVYERLGSAVTIVELADNIIPGVDKGTVRPLLNRMKKKCAIFTSTKVTAASAVGDQVKLSLEGKKAPTEISVDAVLVAVGRTPNSRNIGLEKTGVSIDDAGFISVDPQQRTSVNAIFAIGDVTRGPMLAHKAAAEGRVAAEVASGIHTQRAFRCIPQVAYTEPEIATVGLSEDAAKAQGVDVGVGKFPLAASARAMTLGETSGFSKLIVNKATDVIVGAEFVGPHAGELVAEAALAIQNEMTVAQLTKTVHPHPGLAESTLMAAEVFEGTVTDLFIPKK